MIRVVVAMLAVVLLSGCFLKKGQDKKINKEAVEEAKYDIPTSPPVPPENYCYELHQGNNGADITTLQITVMGDSAFGMLGSHIGQSNEVHGSIIGAIYENTLLATYKQTGSSKGEDQMWKLSADSAYLKTTEIVPRDSTQKGMVDSVTVTISPIMHKVACK